MGVWSYHRLFVLTRKLMSYSRIFTVFTPTYNRESTLPRVYHSLLRQEFKDFEWLIVDDGSSDGTRDLVDKWTKEAWFPIRYEWQPNAGKHMAFNRGVQLAEGQLFLSLDSDDACVPNSLERFYNLWIGIPESNRHKFSAVTVLTEDQHGLLIGDPFPSDILDSDPRELFYRYKVKGEKWGFHRTDILKQFPFPQIEGSSYIPECVVWNAIGKSYLTRYVNECLRTYYINESKTSTLTSQSMARSAKAFVIREEFTLSHDIDMFRFAPDLFLRRAANFTRFSLLADLGWPNLGRVGSLLGKLLTTLMLPVGVMLFVRDRFHR